MALQTPGAFFLGTLVPSEQKYIKIILENARKAGFTRVIEPCCGAFAMSHLAIQAGFKPEQIEASDVTMFSSVFGYALMGKSLEDLEIEATGFTKEELLDPATALYALMYLKTMMTAGSDFFYAMLKDLELRREEHIAKIQEQLDRGKGLLQGFNYRPLDMFEHINEVINDEKTIIIANPPTYACLEVSERILTADLRWLEVGNIKVGDKLVGFDENESPTGRRWYRESIVLRSDRKTAPCVEVELSDGTKIICTCNHPWLVATGRGAKRKFVEAQNLMEHLSNSKKVPLKALRAFKIWDEDVTRNGGWLAGMLDGEGCLNARGGSKASYQLSMAQKRGVLMSNYELLMKERGYNLAIHDGFGAAHAQISESAEVARALGSLRPERLLNKYPVERPARIIDSPSIIAVREIGMREIQSITTSTGTYIGGGFLMHNSGFEKWYGTGGNMNWKEPEYGIFDPKTGLTDLFELMKGAKALIICYEENETQKMAGKAIFTRYGVRKGFNVYLTTNQEEKAEALAEGKMVVRSNESKMSPLDCSTLPTDYVITENSKIEFMQVEPQYCQYYRGIWTHNFVGGQAQVNVVLLIDRYVAGVFGYQLAIGAMVLKDLLIMFGITVPTKNYRLGRLLTMIATNRQTLKAMLTDYQISRLHGVQTTQITKYPESKEMRGVMKLVSKEKGKLGYKLIYKTEIQERTKEETLKLWLKKEETWKQERAKTKSQQD